MAKGKDGRKRWRADNAATLLEALTWLQRNDPRYATLWDDIEAAVKRLTAQKGGGDGPAS